MKSAPSPYCQMGYNWIGPRRENEMRTEPIRLSPNDELARRLNHHVEGPVSVEADGVRYAVVRKAEDIRASCGPGGALKAVENSVRIFKASGVNAEPLLRAVREQRSRGSSGRPEELKGTSCERPAPQSR